MQIPGVSTRTLVVLTLVVEGPLFAAGYFWMRAQGRDPLAELRPSVDGFALGLALGGIIAALSLGSLAVSRRVGALEGWGKFVEGTLGRYLGAAGLPALSLISASAGLGEEMFFRGALQGAIGLVPTALVFGLAHVGIPKRELLPYFLYALLVGLVFGYARQGQLLFPLVVAHAVVDMIDSSYLHLAHARGDGA